jgi:cell division septation protein DedD
VPQNPAELLESSKINQFIEEAKDEYDMIIFDTAPLLSAVDPAILGTKVDGVLLVYRIGTVPKGLLKRAINQLAQVKANVIGVILNGMRPEVSPDFENYKHYKYYYSYGEDGKKRRKKKKLSMFDRRDFNLRSIGSLEGSSFAKVAGWVRKAWHNWKKGLGLSLLVLAVVLLAAGLLWQNALWGPFKSGNTESANRKEEVKIPIKEQPAKDLYREKPSVPAAPASPAAAFKTRSPASGEPHALPREPETIPKPVPEEKEITETIEKPEHKPPVEEPKAEAPSPIAVVPPQKTEARKTPVTKEKPKAESTSARSPSIGNYPFSLFLGSVAHLDQAEQGVSKYRKNGLSAYYAEVELSRGVWYRLYAGYFESAEQAETFKREKGLGEAEVKETPFANLIGTFTTQDKLESKIQSLKGLGFSHYVIRDADGKQRLLVGAFQNEERAKRQYEQLKSKGIESQIVQR